MFTFEIFFYPCSIVSLGCWFSSSLHILFVSNCSINKSIHPGAVMHLKAAFNLSGYHVCLVILPGLAGDFFFFLINLNKFSYFIYTKNRHFISSYPWFVSQFPVLHKQKVTQPAARSCSHRIQPFASAQSSVWFWRGEVCSPLCSAGWHHLYPKI